LSEIDFLTRRATVNQIRYTHTDTAGVRT